MWPHVWSLHTQRQSAVRLVDTGRHCEGPKSKLALAGSGSQGGFVSINMRRSFISTILASQTNGKRNAEKARHRRTNTMFPLRGLPSGVELAGTESRGACQGLGRGGVVV